MVRLVWFVAGVAASVVAVFVAGVVLLWGEGVFDPGFEWWNAKRSRGPSLGRWRGPDAVWGGL